MTTRKMMFRGGLAAMAMMILSQGAWALVVVETKPVPSPPSIIAILIGLLFGR